MSLQGRVAKGVASSDPADPAYEDELIRKTSHTVRTAASVETFASDDEDGADTHADELHQLTRQEFDGLPWHRKPSPLLLIVGYFLFVTAQAIVMAANLDVMVELICRTHYSAAPSGSGIGSGSDPRCRGPTVSGLVATFMSRRTAMVGLMGVLVTPRLAAYSDRFGRKWVLAWSCVCGLLADVISFACIVYPESVDYRFLLLASFVQGSGGSIMTMGVLGQSYVADCVPPSLRSRMLGWMDSCMSAAIAIGPVIGSLILKRYNDLAQLYVVSVCFYVAALLVISCIVAESRPLKARRLSQATYNAENEARRANASTWQHYLHQINIVRPLSLLMFKNQTNLARRRSAHVLVFMAALGTEFVIGLMPLSFMFAELKFKWTSVETGYLMSIMGVTRVFVLAVLFPLVLAMLRKRYSVSHSQIDQVDIRVIRFGQSVSIFGFAAMGNAPTGVLFMCACALEAMSGLQVPATKSAIIKYAPQDRIGELLGALSLVNSFGLAVMPIVFATIFNLTVQARPQMVFEIVSGAFVGLFLLSFLVRRHGQVTFADDSEQGSEPGSEQSTIYGAI